MLHLIPLHLIMCCVFCSGGAGGKGTWGKLTEMYDESGHLHDSKDPNYDSAEEEVSSSHHESLST